MQEQDTQTSSAGGEGFQSSYDKPPAVQQEEKKKKMSPLEEARYFNEENKKLLERITEERIKMEKAAANMMIEGKGFAVQPTKPKEETTKVLTKKK